MARIVISESMHPGAVATLRSRHDVLYDPSLVDDAPRLHRLASDCDALVVAGRTQVRGDLLQGMARCRAIGCLSTPDGNVDVDACMQRRIEVVSESGALATSAAEYVIAAAILLMRGAFAPASAPGQGAAAQRHEAAGKTLGIVGMGPAGRKAAYLAQAIGMEVLAFDPAMDPLLPAFPVAGLRFVEFGELLARSDVVTLHLFGRERARHGFDAATIARLRRGAVLVDTSCNRTVDRRAVAAALRGGALAGAALDDADGALRSVPELAGCPNLLVSPCLAEDTLESSERVAQQVAQRLQKLLR